MSTGHTGRKSRRDRTTTASYQANVLTVDAGARLECWGSPAGFRYFVVLTGEQSPAHNEYEGFRDSKSAWRSAWLTRVGKRIGAFSSDETKTLEK